MKMKALAALGLAAVMTLTACGGGNSGAAGTTGSTSGAKSSKTAGEDSSKTAGTDGSDREGTKAGTDAAGSGDFSEKLTFTAFQQADDNPEFSYDDNPVLKYWTKMFNIEIDWQFPPQGSEAEQLTLMFGTGDYTDIIDMSFNTENLGTLCDDDVIYDLTPYLEAYMPNYYAFLNAPENQDVKSALFDDTGRIYTLGVVQENPKQWGGLLYRKDILEAMTDGNVAFPSGNDNPTTIEDWDYMLPLMKQYFDASGLEEYACLIIPAKGYFENGALLEGYGISGLDFVDNEGNVRYGIAEDAFYDYLVKMKEWYDAGYIYADFASRTQDLFYLPNSSLTYGGAAGVWYGFAAQLGAAMSMPDYGLEMNVMPTASPSIDGKDVLGTAFVSRALSTTGWSISKACSEEKLIRILQACDYLYSEEGGATRSMGLSSEQGAADDEGYISHGMEGGVRLPGTKEWTEAMNKDSAREVTDYAANRLPGLVVDYPARACDMEDGVYLEAYGDEVWTQYGDANAFPYTVSYTPEEQSTLTPISTSIQDYANAMIAKFIMGREELSPESFSAYQEQIKSLGLEQYLSIKQTAYDRYMSR